MRGSDAIYRRGLTLIEVLTAMTVLSILMTMSVPSVIRVMEQSHADIAAANLESIANAQRFYWLANREYAPNITVLVDDGLIASDVPTATARYIFAIQAASTDSFTATAVRTGSDTWTGTLSVDESGMLTGQITGSGQPISPGFQ